MPEKSTYGMNADCRNCGHHFTAQIPKGTKVAEFKGECPHCGVADVVVRKAGERLTFPQPYPVPYVPRPYPYPWYQVWSGQPTTTRGGGSLHAVS